MSVNSDFADEVVERLGRVVPSLRARRMFGGVGLYFGDQFFGIVAFDRLWFKVDLDDSEELKVWAMRSVAVARRAKQKSSLKQSPEKLSINETSHSRPARLFRLRPRDVQEGVVP